MQERFTGALALAIAVAVGLGAVTAFAQDDMEQRMQNLEERQGILGTEFQRLQSLFVLPEDADYKSAYGLGPAASKIYGRERGLSLGGYGQTWLQVFDHKQDKWDYLRFVLYLGYKFTDNLLLNVEIEVEHADEIFLEFATIDYLYRPEMNFRFGMVLMPVGFVNEIHEPPYYYGNQRPVVEQTIIPTTWRENGAGLFGEIADGLVQYRLYTTTNLSAGNTKECCSGTASGFSSSGVRGGRQKGSRTLADMAIVARVDATPMNGLLVGGSVVSGDTGQGLPFGDTTAAATMTMWEGHAQYQYRGLHLRGLYVRNSIEDTDILSAARGQGISETQWGWYGEIAYDILPLFNPDTRLGFVPFVRYERFNTQEEVPAGFTPDETKNRTVVTTGVSFYLHPNVVFKIDYRQFDSEGGDISDQNDLNFGVGYAF